MLNALKSIINSKLTFLETADLILEEMDDADIMDDIIDDELANSDSDIPSNISSDIPSSDSIDTSGDSFSSEEEDEAIYTMGMDIRSNEFKIMVSTGFDDITEDANPMDGFLDESYSFLNNEPDYSSIYYEGVSIADMCYTEDVGDEIPPIDGGGNNDANVNSNPPTDGSNPPTEETEVTTAVKEELKDNANAENNGEPPAPPDENSSDSPEAPVAGNSKIETGRQIMKQLKKAEDITFDYFFNDET